MSIKRFALSVASLLMIAAFAKAQAAGSSGATGPAVKPDAVQKKAGTAPPSTATKTKTAGKSATKLSTANSPTDDDSFWIEKLDIDGDGNIDDANLVWDDEDKVLFAWKDGTFTCKKGGTGAGELLVAVNAAGNPRGRPAGSGFWVAALDKGECNSQTAGLWGCKFDAKGTETACGVATIDEKNDDLIIAVVSK
jgi:hypothetical protein